MVNVFVNKAELPTAKGGQPKTGVRVQRLAKPLEARGGSNLVIEGVDMPLLNGLRAALLARDSAAAVVEFVNERFSCSSTPHTAAASSIVSFGSSS